MAKARSTFPLRFSDVRIREAVREVAEHEHVSQNEYIEQAVVNDLAVRGALRAGHLRAAAARLAELSDEQHAALIRRGLVDFAEGEGLPDPAEMGPLAPAAVAAFGRGS